MSGEDTTIRVGESRRFADEIALPAVWSEWIPVGERLPEKGIYVLAATRFGKTFIACLCAEDHWEDRSWEAISGVTHWMPLPPPPG